MGLILAYDNGQTPLDEDEKEGLLIRSLTTREDLDEFEQNNIQQAVLWALSKRTAKTNVLTEEFVLRLHEKMFGQVWRWAGHFRKTNKNIGIDKYEIALQLRILLDDCSYWIEHKTYGSDEIAIRFKHKLVSIHCFANGNGRHSRLMADIITERMGKDVFSWGGNNLVKQNDTRRIYLTALKKADAGDVSLLISFARS